MRIDGKKPPKANNIIKILFKNGVEKSYRVREGTEYVLSAFKRATLERRKCVIAGVNVEDETLTLINVSEIATIGCYE